MSKFLAEPVPALKPVPIKDRLSVLYVDKGHLVVLDGAFVVVDKTGVRTHIPIGGVACLMLEPGTRISHGACALAARVGMKRDRRGAQVAQFAARVYGVEFSSDDGHVYMSTALEALQLLRLRYRPNVRT